MEALRIAILSDSTGETAERVVRAAMLQFPHSGAQIQIHTRVRTREAVRPILENASKDGGLVVFTVMSSELREYIHALSHELKVEALDLIGSLIGKLATCLDRQPINAPSAGPLTEDYFRRIEAVEFTVRSDDGKEPGNFKRADVVLCGISRTSKTPLSTLLAQRGLKVANQPIVLGAPLPIELDNTPPSVLVVGLTIALDSLVEIRRARLKQLGMPPDAGYGLRDQVKQELDYAHRIFAAHPRWPVVDVSGSAIEETAGIILEALKERNARSRGSGNESL